MFCRKEALAPEFRNTNSIQPAVFSFQIFSDLSAHDTLASLAHKCSQYHFISTNQLNLNLDSWTFPFLSLMLDRPKRYPLLLLLRFHLMSLRLWKLEESFFKMIPDDIE